MTGGLVPSESKKVQYESLDDWKACCIQKVRLTQRSLCSEPELSHEFVSVPIEGRPHLS